MCVVSAVTGPIQQQWPDLRSPSWSYPDLSDLKTILEKLDKLDKKFGTKECSEDAPKEAFLQELAKRVSDLERKLNP